MTERSSGRSNGGRMLVVGASSGIGAAVATGAAAAGWQVVASARRADRLDRLAERDAVDAIAADVCDEGSVRAMISGSVEVLGGLDAVVYTVGASPLVPIADATQNDWRSVFDSNVIGAALVCAAAAPHLLATDGRFVALSSKAVRRPFPDLSLYTTSKIALDGLLRCLPLEFPGLRVTRVLVGNTAGTEFASSWDAQALAAAVERWASSGVLGSATTIDPEDVATTILHVLASPALVDEVSVLDHEGPQP